MKPLNLLYCEKTIMGLVPVFGRVAHVVVVAWPLYVVSVAVV